MIVPSELATSDTTKTFFANLVENGRLTNLFDFQTGMGFFDRVGHARFKFSLVTLGKVQRSNNPTFRVAFYLRRQSEMADRSRFFEMTRDDITVINPNTRTAPIFRSKADAELTKHIYAHIPVLIDDAKGKRGNTWSIEFARLFDMSTDSDVFAGASRLASDGFTRDGRDWISTISGQRYVPLYEAKMIHHYNHRWATYEGSASEDKARDSTDAERADPTFEADPRYWVPEAEVEARLAAKGWARGWLMGWRDICRATDERTVITGPIPRSGCGDKFLLMLPSADNRHLAAFIATLSSLAFDFVARQKLGGTSLKYFVMKQLVAPPPSAFTETELAFIVPRVLELTYTSELHETVRR